MASRTVSVASWSPAGNSSLRSQSATIRDSRSATAGRVLGPVPQIGRVGPLLDFGARTPMNPREPTGSRGGGMAGSSWTGSAQDETDDLEARIADSMGEAGAGAGRQSLTDAIVHRVVE